MGQIVEPVVVPIGVNPTPIWSMSATERLRRITKKCGLRFASQQGPGPKLLVNLAYAFDPQLLGHLAHIPDHVLVDERRIPVIAHLDGLDASLQAHVTESMENGVPLAPTPGLRQIVHDEQFTLYNRKLRKRERPFLMPLSSETRATVERASYYAAYKGVTDILTKYAWPELALLLTRLAAKIGIAPNVVTTLGAALCVFATYLFWQGAYWWGMAAAFIFMVLDTVDGKLARCTLTSSKWGHYFDHGIDHIHPPFWWLAWGMGLGSWGLAFSDGRFAFVMAATIGGYIVQRAIEKTFKVQFETDIHVWETIDSKFRLIAARRNPNMVILFVALLFGRPDIGLELVAFWTIISCLFHATRLWQALLRRRRGEEVISWMAQ
jgi:phosphatidylglycerophosphate synthase